MVKQIAWALNKGIKADYKQYWDVELGVTYVPWDKVKPEELESFCEGGMLDSDTLNPGNAALAGVISLKMCECPEKSWEVSVYGKEVPLSVVRTIRDARLSGIAGESGSSSGHGLERDQS